MELFSSSNPDPMIDKLYMYPHVLTDDAALMVESYDQLKREGHELDKILDRLEDLHPIDKEDLRSWLSADQSPAQQSS